MSSDFLAGLGAFIAGVALACMGAYAYVGKSAARFFGKTSANTAGLFGHAVVVFLLPAGIGLILFGIVFMVGKNQVTSNMLVVGFGLFLLAWALFFVHPKWVQPKWMRSERKKGQGIAPLKPR